MKIATVNGRQVWVADDYIDETVKPEKTETEVKAKPAPANKAKKAPANKARKAGSDK